MAIKLATYKLQPDDTLETVSKLIGVDEFELKHFHNNNCNNKSFIVSSFPTNLKEIIIPSHINIPKQRNKIMDEYLSKSSIDKIKEKYQINYHWLEKIDEEEKVTSFSKIINVECILRNTFIEVIFSSEKIEINKDEEDLLQMEVIALTMAEMYKEIKVKLSFDGTISEIMNVAEIQQNWKLAKENLLIRNGNSPEDKISAYIIRTVDEDVKNQERILNSLSYDYTYDLLLMGIRNQLNKKETIEIVNSTYVGFFPEPSNSLLFKETFRYKESNGSHFMYDIDGALSTSEEEVDFIAYYLSEKLAHPLAVPDDMMKALPESMRKKVLEKKNERIEIFNNKININTNGFIQLDNSIGIIFALDYNIQCSYINRYKKEYTLSVKKYNNE